MKYIDIIREVERLKSLLVLFKEMRDQLLIMDSADTAHPNIVFACDRTSSQQFISFSKTKVASLPNLCLQIDRGMGKRIKRTPAMAV